MHYSWFEPISNDSSEQSRLRQERSRQLARLDHARIRRTRGSGPREERAERPAAFGQPVFFPMTEEESCADGVLATWFVPDGARVAEGDRLAQGAIGTRSVDVTAPMPGTVHLLVDQGNTVVQGTPIAFID